MFASNPGSLFHRVENKNNRLAEEQRKKEQEEAAAAAAARALAEEERNRARAVEWERARAKEAEEQERRARVEARLQREERARAEAEARVLQAEAEAQRRREQELADLAVQECTSLSNCECPKCLRDREEEARLEAERKHRIAVLQATNGPAVRESRRENRGHVSFQVCMHEFVFEE